jgi:hypothetical protein
VSTEHQWDPVPEDADIEWLHEQLDLALAGRQRVTARRMWGREVVAALDLTARFVWFTLLGGLVRAVGWAVRYYAVLAAPTQVVLLFVALFLVALTWGRSGW